MILEDFILIKAAQDVLEAARKDGLPPICIAVCDSNGLPLYFTRMHACVTRSIAISTEKAKTSALMGVSTRAVHERLQKEQLTLADFCGGATTSLLGGLPLVYENKVIGGVGISGRKAEDDEKLAYIFCEKLTAYFQEYKNT